MIYKITLFLQFTLQSNFVCQGQISSNLYYSDKPLNGQCRVEIPTDQFSLTRFDGDVNVLVRGTFEFYFLTTLNPRLMSKPPRPPKDELRPAMTIDEALAFDDSPINHPKCPPYDLVGIDERQLKRLLDFFRFQMSYDEFREEIGDIRNRYTYAFLSAMDDEDFAGIYHSNMEMTADLSLLEKIANMS